MRRVPRLMARELFALVLVSSIVPGAVATAHAAKPACPTKVTYDTTVPSPQSVFGFPLGIGQTDPLTTAQIDQYLAAVDAASDRVQTGVMATSWQGQPLMYAIVSHQGNMAPGKLPKLIANVRALRDPRSLSGPAAASIIAGNPAIVWITGNVHGGEKSGADASLKVLYELAARVDCQVMNTVKDTITVIVPTQNPDGRDVSARQNAYGFDMNRDWFARTQPETQGKIDLLREIPPQVYVDAHERGGRDYFFPPNADPIHHEIAEQPVSWIDGIGEANAAAFGYNGPCTETTTTECYFSYATYDLFFMGYGDTVPTTGFGAAGMTYEKGRSSPTDLRVDQQFRTQWATVTWAAAHRQELLQGYWDEYGTAIAEGAAGELEPNEVVEPDNIVQFPVPDIEVRSYFLLNDRGIGDVRKMVDRLTGMDVEVYRLTEPLVVPNARIFGGRTATDLTVPAGSYWIPMDQPQKHWIQAIVGEDPYVPFPYFYDVSSWSNPLLMGIDTVSTGDELAPAAVRVTGPEGGVLGTAPSGGSYVYPMDSSQASALTFRLLGAGVPLFRDLTTGVVSFPAASAPADLDEMARSLFIDVMPSGSPASGQALRLPRIGLFAGTGISTSSGSYTEARFVIEQRWGTNGTSVTTADINGNTAAFTDLDVLVVPDGRSSDGGLTAAGVANLRSWVGDGGIYIGLRDEGTSLARYAGLTSTTELAPPAGYQVIGSHFRVDVANTNPVGLGRPAEDFEFNNEDPILSASTTGVNVLTYPSDADFWSNGYTQQADALKGTVAVVDEPFGAGHAVLFSYDPLFRAYEESGEHLFANAVLYPPTEGDAAESLGAGAVDLASGPGRAAARQAQRASVEAGIYTSTWRPITIEVAVSHLAEAEAIVGSYTQKVRIDRVGHSAFFVIANRRGLDAEEHPFADDLIVALQRAGVRLLSFSV